MIKRTLEFKIKELIKVFPAIFITGPRQSGKTTICKSMFSSYQYFSLEDLDTREFANTDPRGFINTFSKAKGVILDEAQRVPGIFSYLQTKIDEGNFPKIIITGSQQFQLASNISQSLAGRIAILHMYGFTMSELLGRKEINPEDFALEDDKRLSIDKNIYEVLFTGMYPPIHDRKVQPRDWLSGYVQTYIERDIRDILNVSDLGLFNRFLRLCAGRSGQLLNIASLSSDCGLSHTTTRRWLSLLETSGIIFMLRPFHNNFSKRMMKSPKLFFLDSGLMCFLLGIRFASDLRTHPLVGSVFETFVVSEIFKVFSNKGESPPLSFIRDQSGREVDLIISLGNYDIPVEIKLSQTIVSEFFSNIKYLLKLSKQEKGILVYGGDELYLRENILVRPWSLCS